MSFEVLWLCTEVFSAKFGSVVYFGGTSEQSVQVFSTNLRKFSPLKVSRYTVLVLILASYPGSPPTKSLGTRLPQSQPFILCCLLVSLLQVMEGWMEVCKRGYLNSRLKPILLQIKGVWEHD